MKGSISLFKVFGININIHVTFLLLPLLFLVTGGPRAAFFIIVVFICVVFHELSHSLMAKRFGIEVKDITLLPIGGVASMSAIPEKPSQEFLISIAGPLFNLALAAILYFPLVAIIGRDALSWPPSWHTWPKTIAYIFWMNPILAIFNLLPAFPMDGGRILRSLLARKLDYRKATAIAVNTGHIFALFFGYIGLVNRNFFLILIAIFIYMAASAEEMQVDVRETIRKFHVKDILPNQFLTLGEDIPLAKVLELVFHSHQEDFPVVKNHKLTGFVTRSDIIANVHQFGKERLVRDAMRKEYPTLSPRDHLTAAQKKMEESGFKALPVLADGKLQGVISLEDISRVYIVMSKNH